MTSEPAVPVGHRDMTGSTGRRDSTGSPGRPRAGRSARPHALRWRTVRPLRSKSGLFAIAALGIAWGAEAANAQEGQEVTAIQGARIITFDRGVIEDGSLLIRGSTIAAVGPDVRIPDGATVVDGRGLTATPGIIDAMGPARGHGISGLDGTMRAELVAGDFFDPYGGDYRRERVLRDLVEWGVTTLHVRLSNPNVFDAVTSIVKLHAPGSYEDHFVRYRAAVRVNLGEEPRSSDRFPSTRMGIASLVRQEFEKARDYDRRVTSAEERGEKPPAKDLRLEPLRDALRGELPVVMRAVSPLDIETALRLQEEFGFRLILSGSTQALEAHVLRLVEQDVPVILGTYYSFINSHTGEQTDFRDETAAVLSRGGVTVAFGGLEGETKLLTVNAGIAAQHGMDRLEALKALTLYPARILGVDDRIGSLEAGMDADIVLFRGDPLEITSQVEQVYISGRLVHERAPFDARYTEIGIGGGR
jgi:imidazolonepropionase-like amidohydrolase